MKARKTKHWLLAQTAAQVAQAGRSMRPEKIIFTNEQKAKIEKNIARYGGGFMQALLNAWQRADMHNSAKIETTWFNELAFYIDMKSYKEPELCEHDFSKGLECSKCGEMLF